MRKLLVTDLDGTLWDGTIGEVGRDKIKPNVPYQWLLLRLLRRGVLLAVCSKNDMDTALAGLDHPDNMLGREDFVAFVANWNDKVTNLRRIAGQLNIDLEDMVFVDDSPFERGLVAELLPMVTVAEPGDVLAEYFNGAAVTKEDSQRTSYYLADRERAGLKELSATFESYLAGLDQRLTWKTFTQAGLPRVTQLVNRTNQFNLTTRRRTTDELKAFIGSPTALQFWLKDKFGDNGMIGVIIATGGSTLYIDTWLMSCRVIGRGVEKMMFDVLCQRVACGTCGDRTLIGHYRPTSRNGLVKDHYSKLGFRTMFEEGWYGYDVRANSGNYSHNVEQAGLGADARD